MFSPLARGVGTWNGHMHAFDPGAKDIPQKVFPTLQQDDSQPHHHGVTVTPRTHSAISRNPQSEKPDGEIPLPKTFITRKGALMLFSAPDDFDKLSEKDKLHMKKARRLLRHHYAGQLSKLGKLSRLAQSILIFGDEDYPPEDTSITDPDNKIILKFLHDLDPTHGDKKSKPGAELDFYLHDLKSRGGSARSHLSYPDGRPHSHSDVFLAPSRETAKLSADADCLASRLRPQTAPTEHDGTTKVRSHRVLSADKLRASLRSSNYMRRPSPTPAAIDEERLAYPFTPPASRRSSASGATYRHANTPLLELRHRSKPELEHLGNQGTMHAGTAQSPDKMFFVQRKETTDSENISIHSPPPEVSDVSMHISPLDSLNDTNKMRSGVDSDLPPGGVLPRSPPLEQVADRGMDGDGVVMLGSSASNTNLNEEGTAFYDQEAEQVHRYLEDIQSEDIREEDEDLDGDQGHREGDVPDDVEDDVDLDSLTERSLDGATGSVQPLMPVYSGILTGASAQFSLDNTQAENVNVGDIVIEQIPDHMISDLSGTGHSLQEALKNIQARDEEEHQGVTAVTVIDSRRGSDASSGSGVPADGVHSNRGSRVQSARGSRVQSAGGSRAQSARGSRVQSAKGGRKVGVEEGGDDIVNASPAPPSTRSASPMDLQQVLTMATPEPIKAQLLAGADDLLESSEVWESLKTEAEKVQVEERVSRRQSLQDQTEGGITEEQNVMVEVSERLPAEEEENELFNEDNTIEDSAPPPVNVLEQMLKASSKVAVTEQLTTHEGDNFEGSAGAEVLDDVGEVASKTCDGATVTTDPGRDVIINDNKAQKIQKSSKSTEKPKLKDPVTTKVKDVPKVKPAPKSPVKQYTKPLEVAQMKTPDKKPVEKREPLLKGLESYTMPKKDNSTKSSGKAKSGVKFKQNPPQPSPPSKSKEELALEQLQKEVTEIMGSSEPADTALTAEEMEIERQLLQERLLTAEQKVKGVTAKPATSKRSTVATKGAKKNKKSTNQPSPEEELAKKREAIKEAKKLEKLKRLEEAKQLEEQIKEKDDVKEREEAEGTRKAQILQDEIQMMAREAAAAAEMEEEARQQMSKQRKEARVERESRRKTDLERKKQEAAKRREHERKMMESGKQKEQDMLNRISDGEQRRMLQEEERKKQEEEDRLYQERIEEEEMELERQAEEDEENLRDMERQAEEEALAFLIKEREEAEARKWALLEEAARDQHEQELKRMQIEEEKAKLEEIMRKKNEEELKLMEESRKRFEELRSIEQEALDRLQKEMEQKRAVALQRREVNLERRRHMSKLSHGQGMTRPWVFTYYVHWPRETYEKRMGVDPKKKGFRGVRKPKPKA